MSNLERIVAGTLGALLLVVAVQSLFPRAYVPEPKPPVVEVPCLGTPINVDFAYNGTVNEPWSCQEQCEDDQPRYLLYTNGKATQCQVPPGCNDTGEDTGVTCVPPNATS